MFAGHLARICQAARVTESSQIIYATELSLMSHVFKCLQGFFSSVFEQLRAIHPDKVAKKDVSLIAKL